MIDNLWVVLPAGQRRSGQWIDDTLRKRAVESGFLGRSPAAGEFPRQRVELFRGPDAANKVDQTFADRGWSDGLPVVAPTTGRVARAVAATGRSAGEVIGELDPLRGMATVEKIAVNAVMAGCRPEFMPVVLAAVEAITEPEFNLRGIQTTDENATPLVIVSGPIVDEIGLNCSFGVLGPGWRANATIGRALRLVMHNLGGGWPGAVSFAGAGQPGRYTMCVAENDAGSPWDPLRVELGHRHDESVVVVTRAESAVNVTGGLAEIASVMGSAASAFTVLHGGVPAVLLAPHVAAACAKRGLSRADVARELWERSRVGTEDWERWWVSKVAEPAEWVRHAAQSGQLSVTRSPTDIVVFVAGGDIPIAQHVYFPSWGHPPARIVKTIG